MRWTTAPALFYRGDDGFVFPEADFYLPMSSPMANMGRTSSYSSNGTMLWRGYSGFLSANGTTVLGTSKICIGNANNTLIAEIEP